MPIVRGTDDFGFEDFQNRGRQPKAIPDGVFPTAQEWTSMNPIEKDTNNVNLLKAIRAGALWEIPLPKLVQCFSDAQAEEYADPATSIANLTSGINGLVNTWMSRLFGIKRNDRTHHTVTVRRFTNADDELTVRAFITKNVPLGTSDIHRNGRERGTYGSAA